MEDRYTHKDIYMHVGCSKLKHTYLFDNRKTITMLQSAYFCIHTLLVISCVFILKFVHENSVTRERIRRKKIDTIKWYKL